MPSNESSSWRMLISAVVAAAAIAAAVVTAVAQLDQKVINHSIQFTGVDIRC
jgi:hypothetical protein